MKRMASKNIIAEGVNTHKNRYNIYHFKDCQWFKYYEINLPFSCGSWLHITKIICGCKNSKQLLIGKVADKICKVIFLSINCTSLS